MDWPRFLSEHSIHFITSGHNVAKGNVGVNCPFCMADGDPDPSEHMGISLENRGWQCWRNNEHRGKNPARLIQALIHCSYAEAQALAGINGETLPTDFLSQVQNHLEPAKPRPTTAFDPKLPTSFYTFTDTSRWLAQPYIAYLKKRGYTVDQIERFTKDWGMYYATSGSFDHRIIFTVHYQGDLITWTGRTIYASRKILRYQELTTDPGKAAAQGLDPAAGKLHDYLLWFDVLKKTKAKTIYVVEGPFDALRINVLGKPHGICATCLFTSRYTDQQLNMLHALLPRFEHKHLLLDREQRMLPAALRIESELASLGVENSVLPDQVNDPAELSEGLLLELS